ncbi:MAG: hypothetical protein RLZZ522_1604 [Verrucomicrobiota bacterium]
MHCQRRRSSPTRSPQVPMLMIHEFVSALRSRWVDMAPTYRFLILAGVAAAIGLVGLDPAYRGFKSWRQKQNLVAAREAITGQKMADARNLSLSVLRSGNSCIEAFRILEQSTAALNDPMHSQVSQALMTHLESSDEDRLHAFQTIATELPLGVVGQAWYEVSEKCQQQSRFASAYAARLIAERHFSQAAAVLLAVPPPQRDPAVNQGLLRILIRSEQKDTHDEVQRLLAKGISTAPAAEQSGWLAVLEEMPPLSLREELLEPVRRLLAAPTSAGDARKALALARMDYAADFANRETVIAAAITRWKEQAPEALGRFLLGIGLNQALLDTFPAERLDWHPELLPMVLEAAKATGAWAQVVLLLDAHGELLPKFEELGLRALAAAKAANSTVPASDWQTAMNEAKSAESTRALIKLSLLARDAGLLDESEKAMVAAIRRGRGPLPLYEDLKPLIESLQRQGSEAMVLEICAIYLYFEPGNSVVLTQYAYLACLNNRLEPKAALKAMKIVAEAYPKDLSIQCVLATIYLCDGQYQQAAATLDRLPLDADKLSPSHRITFLVTQLLNGRIAKDDSRITEFKWDDLQPSERKKISELRRSARF